MSATEARQQKMLQSIEEKTGLEPETIIQDIKSQNLEKHNQKIAFVKEKYGLSHGFANLLVLKSKENIPVDLVANQYRDKEYLFLIYEYIAAFLNTLEGVELVPKKVYVSVRAKKQFAIIQPSTKSRIDIGLNFPKDIIIPIEPAGSFNSMVSHRIRIESKDDFSDLAKQYLVKAYELSL
ncbi:DUF4287 domain-containing protein [Winogradskyella sp.]|uniref:DUF4287 domain-containing protein n=1 Tax=Winogradskyella sp. TaxID=1883156 RepID=UPI00262F728E|nr:DUF4287 domain-containing protein [Winogradskyella sp.]